MAISSADWDEWKRMPVTRAVMEKLQELQDETKESLVTMRSETVEGFGIEHIAYRNYIAGLGEILDTTTLAMRVEVSDAN